jgi:gliding-associated putative ABC transporter substrate-binding component GldG
MKHSTTAKTQAFTRILLTVGILIVLNFIAVRLFTRIDLTDQKVFTLSDASIDLVENLDDRVTVRAYFTEDLPAPYNNTRRAVLDILNEYRAYGGDNISFEFVNPVGDADEQEARQQGVPAVEVQVVEEDKFQVKRAHLGIVFLYEDRKEVIPVVQNLSSLEYDISSTIKRVTTRVKKRVGYTTGHGETPTQQYQRAAQELTKQYDLVPVDLTKDEEVPVDLAALLVVSPTMTMSDTAQYLLDQYLMSGGKVAFLLNKMNVNLNSQYRFAQEATLGLESQLEHYGVRVNADLIRDEQCANITVMQQQGMFQIQSQVPFPYLPNTSDFSDNPVVKDFQSLIFYFASSVDTSFASSKGLSAEVLVRTSQKSGRATGFVMVDPFKKWQPSDYGEASIPLAAVINGSFSSFFEGKDRTPLRTSSPDTRIIVVGDGDFMKDDMAGSRNNGTFFVNIVDYLADDAGLITIRSKNIAQPPLDQVEDATKQFIKYANLLLPPFLIIGYGLMRWRRRLSLKRSLESGV